MKLKIFLFALLLSFAATSQAQLVKLLQTNGDSIGLNLNTVWKAIASSNGTNVSVGTKTYYLTTTYANFISMAGGKFTSYDYIVGGATKTFAVNRDFITRAYKQGGNSTVWLSVGSNAYTFDIQFDALFNANNAAYTEFTSFDTIGYVVPTGARALQIVCVGAGGGGGSGRRGAAGGARAGGGGGGGGAYSEVTIEVAALSLDTLIVMIGKGGAGGAAVAVNTTDGNAGTAGVESKVLHGASTLVKASGGGLGAAGTASAAAAGAGGTVGDYAGGAGGASNVSGVGADAADATTKTTGGGGGGGSVTAADAATAGGTGGDAFYGLQGGGAANTAATALTVGRYVGGGGGGGSATGADAGGTGGAGRSGGGGGGGAGSLNGNASGAGGAGGDGYVRIIPIF